MQNEMENSIFTPTQAGIEECVYKPHSESAAIIKLLFGNGPIIRRHYLYHNNTTTYLVRPYVFYTYKQRQTILSLCPTLKDTEDEWTNCAKRIHNCLEGKLAALVIRGFVKMEKKELPSPNHNGDHIHMLSQIFTDGVQTLDEKDKGIQEQERTWRSAVAAAKPMDDANLKSVLHQSSKPETPNYDRLTFPEYSWNVDKTAESPPLIETLEEFRTNLNALSFGLADKLMAGLPLVLAGGSVLACLHRWPYIRLPKEISKRLASAQAFDEDRYVREAKDQPRKKTKKGKKTPDKKPERKEVDEKKYHLPSNTKANEDPAAVGKLFAQEFITSYKPNIDIDYDIFDRRKRWDKLSDEWTGNYLPKSTQHLIEIMCFMNRKCWMDKRSTSTYHPRGTAPGKDEKEKEKCAYQPADLYAFSHYQIVDFTLTPGRLLDEMSIPIFDGAMKPDCLAEYLPITGVASICLEYVGERMPTTAELFSYSLPRARALRSFRNTDFDFFLVTKDEKEAERTIKEVDRRLTALLPEELKQSRTILRTRNAVTFLMPPPYRNIQIVCRLYHSVAQILLGFDLDCCALAYNGADVVSLPRGLRALQTRQNIVDTTRQSTTYEARLYKYARRGFAVAVPGLDAGARFEEANDALSDKTGHSASRLVGATRLIAMLLAANKHMYTRQIPISTRNRISHALDIAGNASDYDCIEARGRPRNEKPNDTPRWVPSAGCGFLIHIRIEDALHGNRSLSRDGGLTHNTTYEEGTYVTSLPHNIVFQKEMPHIQDRVDASVSLCTGSFNPRTSDWYAGK
jgi:hypothetical protein